MVSFILFIFMGIAAGLFLWAWSLRKRLEKADVALGKSLAERKQSEDALWEQTRFMQTLIERKQSEDALWEQTRFMQTLIDAVSCIIFYKDATGVYQICNKAFEAFMGLEREAIVGKTAFDIFPSALASEYDDMDRKALTQGEQFLETQIPTSDDKNRELVIHKTAYQNHAGDMLGIIGVITDVTNHRRTEEKLRVSEELYRSLITASPDAVTVTDMNGRITFVSPNMLNLLSCDREDELLGKNILDLIARDEEDQADRQKEKLEKLFFGIRESEETDSQEDKLRRLFFGISESRHIRKNGSVIFIESKGEVLYDASGNLTGVVYVIRDVTDRRELEEYLNERECLISHIAHASPVILYVYNMAKRRSVFVNRAVNDILGYTPDEIQEMGDELLSELMHPDDLSELPQYMRILEESRKDEIIEVTYRMRHRNGEERCLTDHILVFSRNPDGEIREIMGAIQDITEKRRAQDALRESKKAAESANQAKSEFLANVSHEFRTPLNAILGYTQILKRDNRLTDHQSEAIDIIHRSGDHLLLMINDILDFSKIEAQKLELASSALHLPSFLRIIADIVQIRAQQKDIGFVYNMASDLPEGICGDEKHLRQILLNLLSNAVKFTEKGEVRFAVKMMDEGIVRFQVADTGVGIPDEKAEDIFLPFHQVGVTRLQSEGTGLGLAISRKLVRMMGSELHMNSRPGQGSTFWFDAPLPPADLKTIYDIPPDLRLVGFKEKECRIVVVDDDKESRMILTYMLSPFGFQITEAVDGADALEKMREIHPDLALIDMVMPGMDGFEVIRQIRETPEWEDMVIIAVSASVKDSEKRKCMAAGCRAFVEKPVRADELIQNIKDHLKLEWIYEEETDDSDIIIQPETMMPLVSPPREQMEMLLNLAMMGDVHAIRKEAEKMMSHPEYEPFGEKLSQLAKNFQVMKLKEFLSKGQEAKNKP